MNILKSLFGKTETVQTVNRPNMNAKQEQGFSAFRQLVGDPYQQTPEMFVRKVAANSPAIEGKPRFLANHVQLYTRIIADLGFDELDLAEIIRICDLQFAIGNCLKIRQILLLLKLQE
jgi:hypothetical protein